MTHSTMTFSKMTLSRLVLNKITLSTMNLSKAKPSIKTISIIILRRMTISLMTHSRMTFSTLALSITSFKRMMLSLGIGIRKIHAKQNILLISETKQNKIWSKLKRESRNISQHTVKFFLITGLNLPYFFHFSCHGQTK